MKAHAARYFKLVGSVALAAAAISGLFLAYPVLSEESRSLDTLMEIHERWEFGQISPPTDSNGNAVAHGVVLMPVPDAPGDGTPGSVDVTLNENQPFALPLWVLLGTSYDDGTPPDPFEPLSIFKTLDIRFTVDGHPVIGRNNAMDYFSKFRFVPKIPVSFPPINGVIWFEGIGIVHDGLERGEHTLKLDAKNTQPAFGSVFEYHNTWRLKVKRTRQ